MKKLLKFSCFALAAAIMLTITACSFANATTNNITVPSSLTTVKLDSKGNNLGNITFNMTGTIDDKKANISFDRLDTYESYNISTLEPDGIKGGLLKYDFAEFSYFVLNAYKGNDISLFYVAFSPDGDYWLISNESEDLYYYGCVSGNATTEELIEYFAPMGLKTTRAA